MNIFVIDDDKLQGNSLKNEISKTKNDLNVTLYTDLTKAYECIDKYTPKAIFVNMDMANLQGLKFCQKVKDSGIKCNLVFVSADHDYVQNAMDMFASGYIVKPVNQNKISEQLDNLRY